MKPVYILGINGSARASAALLKDGQLLAGALEERFTRAKNQAGYPKHAINYCLGVAKISSAELDSVYLGSKNPTIFIDNKNYEKSPAHNFLSIAKSRLIKKVDFLSEFYPIFHRLYELRKKTPIWNLLEKQQRQFLAGQLNISESRIHPIDHHTSHGFAAYFTNPDLDNLKGRKTLVITLDGAGDAVCSRIFVVQNNSWQEIASTSNDYSLGWLYEYVTQYLGMTPNEDEYKVMGLSPYASSHHAERVYNIFKKMMYVEELSIKSSIPRISYPAFLYKNLVGFRFDAIAGGIQKLTEELTTQLVQNAIKKTGIHNVVLGGGVFMNVKANMKIAQIKEVESLWICPSSTDDSTAIGAAYYGYRQFCILHHLPFHPKSPKNLYLGPSYPILSSPRRRGSNSERDSFNWIPAFARLAEASAKRAGITIKTTRLKNPAKQIAKLLSQGKVVAHFAGKMEFGARALGNRSILADPRDINIIKIINFIIKKRDFWMPFAPTILKEEANKYLLNPKNIDSPYMMMAFPTTNKAQKDLAATLHPYDNTARAQILSREENPEYWEIIKEFEKITGVGAILNTSFNLHGEPIVCTPKDALETFMKSGLEYLVLEDYLISKKSSQTHPNFGRSAKVWE